MSSYQSSTFPQLLLEIATTGRRSFTGCRFTGDGDLEDPAFRAILAYYPDLFPFEETSSRWRLLPSMGLSFTQCDFSGCALTGWDLSSASFDECAFQRTRFSNCALHHCRFERCKGELLEVEASSTIEETTFSTCDLGRASLSGDVRQCDFRFCTMPACHARTTFSDCRFDSSQLSGSSLLGCRFPGTSFDNCDLQLVQFQKADFSTAIFCDQREIIGSILYDQADLPLEARDPVANETSRLRQMVALYVQQAYGQCWRNLVATFAPYPGILAWAYQVLKPYKQVASRLATCKKLVPEAERALISRWEQEEENRASTPSSDSLLPF